MNRLKKDVLDSCEVGLAGKRVLEQTIECEGELDGPSAGQGGCKTAGRGGTMYAATGYHSGLQDWHGQSLEISHQDG